MDLAIWSGAILFLSVLGASLVLAWKAGTQSAEKATYISQKQASDRDVEKYRHEAEIKTEPPETDIVVTMSDWQRMRDKHGSR